MMKGNEKTMGQLEYLDRLIRTQIAPQLIAGENWGAILNSVSESQRYDVTWAFKTLFLGKTPQKQFRHVPGTTQPKKHLTPSCYNHLLRIIDRRENEMFKKGYLRPAETRDRAYIILLRETSTLVHAGKLIDIRVGCFYKKQSKYWIEIPHNGGYWFQPITREAYMILKKYEECVQDWLVAGDYLFKGSHDNQLENRPWRSESARSHSHAAWSRITNVYYPLLVASASMAEGDMRMGQSLINNMPQKPFPDDVCYLDRI